MIHVLQGSEKVGPSALGFGVLGSKVWRCPEGGGGFSVVV